MAPEIGPTHWAFLIFVIAVVIAMILRRGVVLLAALGTFVIAMIFTGGDLVSSLQKLFGSFMEAGTGLFDIMLVIAMMVGMLKTMESMGSDYLMVAPIKKLLQNPTSAFFILGVIMYVCALFFWPTPATALVGVILVPVAVKAGMPAMAAAMTVNILGHGMALSGDMVLQGAPAITSGAADVPIEGVLSSGAILSITAGVVAIIIAFFMVRKELAEGKGAEESALVEAQPKESYSGGARFIAIAVPVVFIVLVIFMAVTGIRGGAATSLLGGTAAFFILLGSLISHSHGALEKAGEYIREGLMFSIKIFAVVIPIAGFFYLGAPGPAEAILGEGAPGLLFDLGEAFAAAIPVTDIPVAFGVMIMGVITGLDGSGFSGLPLVGSMARALGGPLGIEVSTLAALGQVGSVFSGGGTLTAWAFGLVATAGVAGVSPLELARKNFIPVACGLFVATILAIIMM